MDLRDLGTRRLSWRRLRVLVQGLPRESRVLQTLDPRLLWSPSEYLTASVVDALHGANWQRGGSKGPRPKALKRPGAQPREKRIGNASMPIDKWRRKYEDRFPERRRRQREAH